MMLNVLGLILWILNFAFLVRTKDLGYAKFMAITSSVLFIMFFALKMITGA